MDDLPTLEMTDGLVNMVGDKTSQNPRIGTILGFGLGTLVEDVQDPDEIPYLDSTRWPVSTVESKVLAPKLIASLRGVFRNL